MTARQEYSVMGYLLGGKQLHLSLSEGDRSCLQKVYCASLDFQIHWGCQGAKAFIPALEKNHLWIRVFPGQLEPNANQI